MNLKCVKDVVVNGRMVYEEGKVYQFKEIFENGELISYEIESNLGLGVWQKDDPTFEKFFKKNTYKIFKFEESEGTEIIAASNAKEAVIYYFTSYHDDSTIDDMIEYGGIKINKIEDEELTKQHFIYNEEEDEHESISYGELADKYFTGEPTVLVFPNV